MILVCPKCGAENPILDTDMSQTKSAGVAAATSC